MLSYCAALSRASCSALTSLGTPTESSYCLATCPDISALWRLLSVHNTSVKAAITAAHALVLLERPT